MDNEIQNTGASAIASDDSAWSAGAAPNIAGGANVPSQPPQIGANVQKTPQTPQPDQQQPAVPTRKFEQPGEFFRSVAHSLAGAMLGATAGPDPVQYSRDANGELVTTRPASSNGDKLRRIAQAALTGLAAGAAAPRRPGAEALSGLAAGAGAQMKKQGDDDLLKRKQADEDFESKAKADLQKHDIAYHNALTVSTFYGHVKAQNDLNPHYAENEALLKAAKESPDFNGHVMEMTDDQVEAAIKADHNFAVTHIIKPLGWAPVLDNDGHPVVDQNGQPKEYLRVGVIEGTKDGNIDIPSEVADAVHKYGPGAQVLNAENIKAGDSIPFDKFISMMNAVNTERKSELQGWQKAETVFGGKDGKTPMQQNPYSKEVRDFPKDKDGNPIIPNVKNLPAESQAAVDNKENKGEITARDKFIQDREDARADKRKNSSSVSENLNPPEADGLQGEEYLAALSPQDQSVIKAVGEGRETMTLQNRKGELTALGQAVMRAYPDFDRANAKAYPEVVKDFTTGKSSQALTAYGTAINHARSLLDNTGPSSYIPGTAENKRYSQDVTYVATEVAKALNPTGVATESAIKEQEDNLRSFANRKEAIINAAHILTGKMAELKQRWANGQVRKSYRPPMPNLSPEAIENMDFLLNYGKKSAAPAKNPTAGKQGGNAQMPPGATHIVPGPDGRNHYTNAAGTVDLGVAN